MTVKQDVKYKNKTEKLKNACLDFPAFAILLQSYTKTLFTSIMHPPIFILCYSRTGSTLLRYIFDSHDKVCSPPELHLGRLSKQLAHRYVEVLEDSPTLNNEIINLCRDNINGIMDAYCKRRGADIWCEKSISTIDTIQVIQAVFPNARFVALHRHCLDVLHSSLEMLHNDPDGAPNGFGWSKHMAKYPNDIHAGLISYWIDKTNTLLNFEKENKDICIRVKYEDIVSNTAITLERLFTSLDLAWDPAIIDKVFTTDHDTGNGDGKILKCNNIHSNSVGTGASVNISGIPKQLIERVNDQLTMLDYKMII